jgi:hypothetical protein
MKSLKSQYLRSTLPEQELEVISEKEKGGYVQAKNPVWKKRIWR